MSELTREKIERWKSQGAMDAHLRMQIFQDEWRTLCDMALRSLTVESAIEPQSKTQAKRIAAQKGDSTPLGNAIKRAAELLLEEAMMIREGETNLSGPNIGKMDDQDAIAQVKELEAVAAMLAAAPAAPVAQEPIGYINGPCQKWLLAKDASLSAVIFADRTEDANIPVYAAPVSPVPEGEPLSYENHQKEVKAVCKEATERIAAYRDKRTPDPLRKCKHGKVFDGTTCSQCLEELRGELPQDSPK